MKEIKSDAGLDNYFLFKNVLKEWLPALRAHRKVYRFKKGETIFEEGSAVKGIYFIDKGKAKVHMKWDDNKDLIVRFAGDGEILGHRGYGKELAYSVSATAMETSDICFMDNDFFFSTLRVNNEFLLQLMLFFAEELKISERKMRDIALAPAKTRLLKALEQLQDLFGEKDGENIHLKINKQDLASYIGTTYETLFRLLNELQNEGILQADSKTIRFSNIKPG
ncbi:MAG: Crp/Fnr family transcriptional regulator [Chitinophagaceae bacterium]